MDLIVKFGGSAITDKTTFEMVKSDALQKASYVIKQCVEHKLKCIVVHGAGSFGHHQARQYKVNAGWAGLEHSDQEHVREGFVKTRLSVLQLNHLVTDELIKAGVHAIGVPACGIWNSDIPEFSSTEMAIHAMECINNGFVPVFHGDCIFTPDKGCRILSGDVIIRSLCEELQVNRVVFFSDVTGVYNKPPNTCDKDPPILIRHICAKHDGTIDIPVSTSVIKQDVTGGIQLKIESACNIVVKSEGKTLVYICDVTSKAAENICVCGDYLGEPGTQIKYQQ